MHRDMSKTPREYAKLLELLNNISRGLHVKKSITYISNEQVKI